MKKITAFLLAIAMVFSLAATAFAASVTPVFSATSVAAGETVAVEVKLDEAMTGITNFEYRLFFNPDLFELQRSEKGPANSLTTITSKAKTNADGTYYGISLVDPTSQGMDVNAGVIYTLVFVAKADLTTEQAAAFKLVRRHVTGYGAEAVDDGNVTSGEVSIAVTPAKIAVTGITLDKSELTLTVGETGTLTANVDPENATDKTVTWTSSNESVATVVGGTVTAVAAGSATITAKVGEYSATCTVTVTENQEVNPATGYTVAASEDVSITAGENAEVSITVTEADSKAYNAYQLNVTYPEGLTYVSTSGSGVKGDNFKANHDEAGRTIQIIGYGADKASGTAAAKLTFTGSTVSEYEVTISSAKVDAAASAPTQNTPDAAITDAATKITVTGYTVTLGGGLTADSFVAYPGIAYTFKATDADNYDYTVTAKVGETEINVSDNGDGTYTIPADQITGNITVSAVMNPKSYDVTYDGTTTENAATYKTPYVFTPEKEGYTVGGVTVIIGGEGYTGYSTENGTYTIPGADITGDIVITINWVEKTPETVTVTRGDGVNGGNSATKGEDYTFSFGETDEYDYDEETLEVKVGDTDITDKVTKNEETGEYTIPGNLINGDITISIDRTEKATFTVEVSEYLTLDEGNMYLVTVKGVEDGKVAKYDGQNMFWSAQTLTTGENGEETTGYGAYAWLVISNEGLDAVKTAAPGKVSTAEGTTDLTVDYSGDVNGTEKVDVNDAQLVYNMYKAYYGDFTTVSMQKFLDADVNSDQTVNVTDAAAVVTAIINAK